MSNEINRPNGIHLNVRATTGGSQAGRWWIPVPDGGVPADVLPSVAKYLETIDGRPESSGGFVVDTPTWEGVRAEIAEDERVQKKREADRAVALEQWRKSAAAYLAGGDKDPSAADGRNAGAPDDEIKFVLEEKERRRAAAVAETTAQVEAVIERLAGGEGNLDTPGVGWVEIDGHRITWDRNGIGIAPDTKQRLEQISLGRRDDDERRKAEAKASAIAERDAWITAHGSPRLKKGLAVGMVDSMGGVYLDERIAHDLGTDWVEWGHAPEPTSNDRLNPSEAELDALAEARAKWPRANARLKSVGGEDNRGYEHSWRPALMVDCPWDTTETAIKYLD